MKLSRLIILSYLSALTLIACQPSTIKQSEKKLEPVPAYSTSKQFNDYWYNNQAELDRYELRQARYGSYRNGDAVFVFVTEHMNPETHVKAWNAKDQDIPVMKMNQSRKFITGIYPYSIMSSVFTPVNLEANPFTLRETFTGQEWCGQEFTRLDYSGTGYEGMLDSYFPDEGDQPLNLGNAMLEDEIYTRIRINPESLPLGDVLVIPSMQHNRFRHLEIGVQKANTKSTDSVVDNQNLKIYTLNYQKIDRSLSVVFEAEFPHKILQFRESFLSGFGDDAHKMTTVGTLTNSIMLDYWTKNNPQDTTYRKSLGLSQ